MFVRVYVSVRECHSCAGSRCSVVTVMQVSCEPCPLGGDCSGNTLTSLLASVPGPANSVVQQANIVALPGFWASNTSDGLSFFKCNNPVSCIQVGWWVLFGYLALRAQW